jgi:hypothetical protein
MILYTLPGRIEAIGQMSCDDAVNCVDLSELPLTSPGTDLTSIRAAAGAAHHLERAHQQRPVETPLCRHGCLAAVFAPRLSEPQQRTN